MFEAQKEWICPENFPNLKGYSHVAIDLETKDPELKAMGSGAVRGHGNIVGIAVAVDGWSAYYPIAHEGGGNLDKDKVMSWIKSYYTNLLGVNKEVHWVRISNDNKIYKITKTLTKEHYK